MPSRKNRRGYSERQNRVKVKDIRKRILIVCEGTKTEPNYFEGLRREFRTKVYIDIEPAGRVHLSLVKRAKQLADDDGEYDEVWCVFDRDLKAENKNQENFNQAIITAKKYNFKLAVSNDAFELWFILHFEYYCSQTHRSNFKKILSDKKRLGVKYKKNNYEMYDILKERQEEAIVNAKKLWKRCDREIEDHQSDIDKLIKKYNINPSTTVYQFIERIQEISKDRDNC